MTSSQQQMLTNLSHQAVRQAWRSVKPITRKHDAEAAAVAAALWRLHRNLRPTLDHEMRRHLAANPVDLRGPEKTSHERLDHHLEGLAGGISAARAADSVLQWFNPRYKGGLSYSMDTTMKTEFANTLHDAQKVAANVAGIRYVMWEVSASHTRPDECDDYDGQIYPVDLVPEIPHANCYCTLQDVTRYQ